MAQLLFTPTRGEPLEVTIVGSLAGSGGIWTVEGPEGLRLPVVAYNEIYATGPGVTRPRRVRSDIGEVPQVAGKVYISADTDEDFQALVTSWETMCEEMRRRGGEIAYTPPAGGTEVTYDVESGMLTELPQDMVYLQQRFCEASGAFPCLPYGRLAAITGHPLTDSDPFNRDTIAEGRWTFDTGEGTLTIADGVLTSDDGDPKYLVRTGLTMADGRVRLKYTTGASTTAIQLGLILKYDDTDNYLMAFFDAAHLEVWKHDGGSDTQLANTPFVPATDTDYWIDFEADGDDLEVSVYDADPETGATALATVSHTLAGGDDTQFGAGVWGEFGIWLDPSASFDETADAWRADAAQFRSTNPIQDLEVRDVPGSVPCLPTFRVTDTAGEDRSHAMWGAEVDVYDPDDPWPLYLDADNLDDSFAGTPDTEGGVNVIRATLTTSPIVLCGSGVQHHVGTFRHLPRLFGEGTGPIWVRLVYKRGSSPQFTENGDGWQQLQGLDDFYELDLGLMHILEAVKGDQTCEWRIEAYSETPADTLAIAHDQLVPGPGGKARTPLVLEIPEAFTLREEFDQSAGNLNGKAIAQAGDSEGPNAPGTLADDSGIGTEAWSDPANAGASDDTYASVAVGGIEPEISHYLKVTNLGFSIPSGATIDGIVARVEGRASTGNDVIQDHAVRLVKGGVVQATDRSKGGDWGTVDVFRTYGGPTDLWGDPTLDDSDVNASGFGFAIAVRGFGIGVGGTPSNCLADLIDMRVYYTDSGGQTWSTTGDAVDIAVESTGHTAQRSEVSDADLQTGRYAVAGTTVYSDVGVKIRTKRNASVPTGQFAYGGLLLRYTDTNNWLQVVFRAGNSSSDLIALKRVAGTVTQLAPAVPKTWETVFKSLAAMVIGGVLMVTVEDDLAIALSDSDLEPGGALDDGKVGFYDAKTGASAITRTYDDYGVWLPTVDHVIAAARPFEVQAEQVIRQAETGEWGELASTGAYLELPPAGRDGWVTRIAEKERRNDVDELPDTAINDERSLALDLTPRVALL